MIEIIIGILFLIVLLIATFKSLDWFMLSGIDDWRAWASGAIAVVMLAFALNAAAKHEQEHPCVTYESRLTYNAATKTMMPMRVCVERGEWVTEGGQQ